MTTKRNYSKIWFEADTVLVAVIVIVETILLL